MSLLKLTDSQFIKSHKTISGYFPDSAPLIAAIDKLTKEFTTGEIQTLRLNSLGKNRLPDEKPIIWYEIQSLKAGKNIDKVEFFTSHFIGFYSTKIDGCLVEIIVEPRYGYKSEVFNYLLSYACNLYLPKGDSSIEHSKGRNFWMMARLWKAMLDKAISQSQIPKEYIQKTKNLETFKGRLNINRHIHINLIDQSKFYCKFKKLTMDNTINQTIRYIYKLLSNNGLAELLKDIQEHDSRLGSFGVQNTVIFPSEIDNINYSKLNIGYKQVMQLSKAIISNDLASNDINSNHKAPFAYFIDMSELWELYLLKVLRNNLPVEYQIYSPNNNGGEWLLENSIRQIRPDILIADKNNILMIIDAKYKNYSQLGKYSSEGISREDLYQMNTYIYHYGKNNPNMIGLFVSPVSNSVNDDIHYYTNNEKHKIGLINLDIDTNFEKDEFKFEIFKREQEFCNKIERLLSNNFVT